MDIFRNKEYIYCVYQEKSFCKAAEKLHISQPALSAMVKKTELQLGLPIFNRRTKPISLTPFGTEYIRNIEIVDELEERLYGISHEMQSLQDGQLFLSASNLGIDYLTSELIADYKKRYPKIKLSIINLNTLLSKQLLDSRQVDLMITTRPLNEAEYEKVFLSEEYLVLLVPKELSLHPDLRAQSLAHKDLERISDPTLPCVPLSAFLQLPFIVSNSNNYLRTCTNILFQEAGFQPDIVLEVEETAIGLNFAKYGIGAMICNHLLLEKGDFENHFLFYKLDSQYSKRTSNVFYRIGTYITPAMSKFLELARDYNNNQ